MPYSLSVSCWITNSVNFVLLWAWTTDWFTSDFSFRKNTVPVFMISHSHVLIFWSLRDTLYTSSLIGLYLIWIVVSDPRHNRPSFIKHRHQRKAIHAQILSPKALPLDSPHDFRFIIAAHVQIHKHQYPVLHNNEHMHSFLLSITVNQDHFD